MRNVPSRLPSTVARHPSSGICSSGAGRVKLPPALATRMPTGPQASSIWRRTDSTWPKSVTSPVAAMALPPSRMIAAATLSAAAWSRPCTATAAPRRANSAAMAAPMPRVLPVTRAICPSSALMSCLPLASGALRGAAPRRSLTLCLLSQG